LVQASKNALNLLNQIEKNSSKILFGLVCQNVFGTDCVHVYVVIHFYDSMWIFFSGNESVQDFIYRLFIQNVYALEMVRIPLTTLTLPYFCVCPKLEPGIPTPYVMVFFVCCQ
jgi:hypothetical protein